MWFLLVEKKGASSSPFSSSALDSAWTGFDCSFASFWCAVLRPRFTGFGFSSRLRSGEATPFAAAAALRFLVVRPTAGVCIVVAAVVDVVVVVAGVTFARDVARVFVTVCCDSVTVCDSTWAEEVALVLRAFFLGSSGGGVDSCCALCTDADCAGSADAAVRRVMRRVAVDIVAAIEVSRRDAQYLRGLTRQLLCNCGCAGG